MTEGGQVPIDPSAVELVNLNSTEEEDPFEKLGGDQCVPNDPTDLFVRVDPRRRVLRRPFKRTRFKVGRSLTSCTLEWDTPQHNSSTATTSTIWPDSPASSIFRFNRRWFTSRLNPPDTTSSLSTTLPNDYLASNATTTYSSSSQSTSRFPPVHPHTYCFSDPSSRTVLQQNDPTDGTRSSPCTPPFCNHESFRIPHGESYRDSLLPSGPVSQFRHSVSVAQPPNSSSFSEAHNNQSPNTLLPSTRSINHPGVEFSPSLEFRWIPTDKSVPPIEWESWVSDDSPYSRFPTSGSVGTIRCVSRIDSNSSQSVQSGPGSAPLRQLSDTTSHYTEGPSMNADSPTLSPISLAEAPDQESDNDDDDDDGAVQLYHQQSAEEDGVHSMPLNINAHSDVTHPSSEVDYDEDDLVSDLPTQFTRGPTRGFPGSNDFDESLSMSTRDLGTPSSEVQNDHTEERRPSRYTEQIIGQHNQSYPGLERGSSRSASLRANPPAPTLSSGRPRRDSQRKPSHSSAGSVFSEVDELDLLTPEAILCKLVQLKGQSLHIYLERDETERLHLERMERFFLMFRRQYLSDSTSIRTVCRGKGAGIAMIVLGTILIVLGLIPYFLGNSFKDTVVFYSSHDVDVPLKLDIANWDEHKEALVYFHIEKFYGCFRPTYSSRPRELFPGYSCHSPGTLEDIAAQRPLDSLPEIAPYNQSDYFPCGLSSFSLFNDHIRLYFIDSSGSKVLVDWNIQDTAPDFPLITYAKLNRPPGLTRDQDWIDVMSPEYRNWMETPLGSDRRLLVARIPNGLAKGEYAFKIEQNVWPSELWSAKKAVAIAQLSPVGSSQSVLGLFFIIWGAMMVVLGFLFLSFLKKKRRWKTQSASEVPEGRIEEIVSHLCKQNEAVRKELFARLQRRRLRGSRFSIATG